MALLSSCIMKLARRGKSRATGACCTDEEDYHEKNSSQEKFNFITKETRLFMTIYFQVVRIIILLHHCLWHQIFSNQSSK
jgi:hypothetical protein